MSTFSLSTSISAQAEIIKRNSRSDVTIPLCRRRPSRRGPAPFPSALHLHLTEIATRFVTGRVARCATLSCFFDFLLFNPGTLCHPICFVNIPGARGHNAKWDKLVPVGICPIMGTDDLHSVQCRLRCRSVPEVHG